MIYRLIALYICIVSLVFIAPNCGDNNDNDSGNDISTGGDSGSPDDEMIRLLADEFAEMEGVERPRIEFFDGPVDEFIKVLQNTEDTYHHVDFILVYDNDLDTLIREGWIQPYPEFVDANIFKPEAVKAVTRNGTVYGIPLFIREGKVKCVTVSTKIQGKLTNLTLNLNKYFSAPENVKRLVEVVPDSTSAYMGH